MAGGWAGKILVSRGYSTLSGQERSPGGDRTQGSDKKYAVMQRTIGRIFQAEGKANAKTLGLE